MLMTTALAQRFEDTATDVEFAALVQASDAAQHPALHPDQFRYLMLVMLPQHPTPVPVVATVGIDSFCQPQIDDAWVFLPGRHASKVHRGDTFARIRREVIGEHWNDLRARAAEQRAQHPLAA